MSTPRERGTDIAQRSERVFVAAVLCAFTALGALESLGLFMISPGHGEPNRYANIVLVACYYAFPVIAFVAGIAGLLALPRRQAAMRCIAVSALAATGWFVLGELVA